MNINDKLEFVKQASRSSLPSSNGLFPEEIMMLSYAEKYSTSTKNFPKFWLYDFAVSDPKAVLDSLLRRGFIEIVNAKDSLCMLKADELKAILSDFKIKPEKKKGDMITQIQNNISDESISDKIKTRYYKLTDLGKEELKENEYVTYFGYKVKYGLTVWDMNKMLADYPKKLFRDRIWGKLNENMCKATEQLNKSGDFYTYYRKYIYNRYEMCDFLIEENRNPETAFNLLVEGLYYDILVEKVVNFKIALKNAKVEAEPIQIRVRDPETGKNKLITKSANELSFDKYDSLKYHAKNLVILNNKMQKSLNQSKETILSLLPQFFVNDNLIKQYDLQKDILSENEIADLMLALAYEKDNEIKDIYKKIENAVR